MSREIFINGIQMPTPSTMSIVTSQAVDGGRNVNGVMKAQLVGRLNYKIDNLSWNGLNEYQWKIVQNALSPFYVAVTFCDDTGTWRTLKMYHGDTTAEVYTTKDGQYFYNSCKVNLIDCGA